MEKQLNHLAIIPDGNRRWARKKNLLAWQGHREGGKRIEDIIKSMETYSEIKCLTFWIASRDNLTKRSEVEVGFLYKLFNRAFKQLLGSKMIDDHKVRVRILGDWKPLAPKDLIETIEKLEKKTKGYSKYHLTFLLGYSGVEEMTRAINLLREEKKKKKITNQEVNNYLRTGDLPPVDLLIRTGGEPHNSSGFMMWHTADSQYYFTDTLFPAFKKRELGVAIKEYHDRERRLGT
jgi:undecaprenyl diphosphate synthase